MTSSILERLRHRVVKQMSKQCCLYFMMQSERLKCKKENSSQELQDGTGNVLGLFYMDIIVYKGRPISF